MSLFGSLFGQLLGNVFGDPNAVPATPCQPTTVEFAELAVEIIDDFVESPNAVWVSIPVDVPSETNDWDIERATATEYPVKIVFLQDDLEDRQLIQYLKKTAVPTGLVNGIMYPQGFVPNLKDIVRWQGRELNVRAIDPIAPIDCPIIYMLEFGS